MSQFVVNFFAFFAKLIFDTGTKVWFHYLVPMSTAVRQRRGPNLANGDQNGNGANHPGAILNGKPASAKHSVEM